MDETTPYRESAIGKLVQEYLEDLRARKYSAATLQCFGENLKYFGGFLTARGKVAVLDVTAQDLDDYRLNLVERGLKTNSVYTYLRAVRSFFRYLHAHDHVFVNPAEGLRMPGPDRRLQPVPTEDEIRALLAQPDVSTAKGVRDRTILEVLYSTAIRRQEMAELNVEDVDMDNRVVKVMGKGKRERVVPLGREAVEWLKRYLAEARDNLTDNKQDPALWINNRGGRMSAAVVHILVKTYARTCNGIATHITIHSLRRACATHMLQHGANPLEVQMLLGHADLTHLRNYLKTTVTDLKAAHAKTRLGE